MCTFQLVDFGVGGKGEDESATYVIATRFWVGAPCTMNMKPLDIKKQFNPLSQFYCWVVST